jgi:hypothetical protein
MTAETDNTLRGRLQAMTEAQSKSEYLAMLAAVARDFPNAIVLLDSPYPIQRYTCLMHVFEFTEKPEYAAMASRGFNVVFAGPTFAHWLLEKQLLTEVGEAEVREGDLIFYFNEEGRMKHAGLSRGVDRVESKWGKGGLFQHGLVEIPSSYGTTRRFFRKIPYEEALEYFRRFAKEKGMLFLD